MFIPTCGRFGVNYLSILFFSPVSLYAESFRFYFWMFCCYIVRLLSQAAGSPWQTSAGQAAGTTDTCSPAALEAGRPRWRCQRGWFSVRPPLLTHRRLSSPCVLPRLFLGAFLWGETQRQWDRDRRAGAGSAGSLVFPLPGTLILSYQGPTLWPHLTLISSSEALSPNAVTWGVRAPTFEPWRGEVQFSPQQSHFP